MSRYRLLTEANPRSFGWQLYSPDGLLVDANYDRLLDDETSATAKARCLHEGLQAARLRDCLEIEFFTTAKQLVKLVTVGGGSKDKALLARVERVKDTLSEFLQWEAEAVSDGGMVDELKDLADLGNLSPANREIVLAARSIRTTSGAPTPRLTREQLAAKVGLNPTDEQWAVVEAFHESDRVAVEALAGTGKSTTLRLLAESTPKSGLYCVYNKAAQQDAEGKFPPNVEIRTLHSLAYRAVGAKYRDRLGKNSPAGARQQRARTLGIIGKFSLGEGRATVDPVWQVRFVEDALARFYNSRDPEPTARHFPWIHAETPGKAQLLNNHVRAMLLPFLMDYWEDVQNPKGTLLFTHDAYLKIWLLSNPDLKRYGYLMVDEAQDIHEAAESMWERQSVPTIVVGDEFQQLYEWRNTRKFISTFNADARLPLSGTFRFNQEIADEANLWLRTLNAPHTLKGLGATGELGIVDNPDAILCRTNAQVVEAVLETLENDLRPHVVGSLLDVEIFCNEALKLQAGKLSTHIDLAGFETWQQAQKYARSNVGSDIAMLVRLVDRFTAPVVLAACGKSVPEAQADVTISTIHRAKGREWDDVQVRFSPFAPGQTNYPPDEALRLAYVGTTRAMRRLDVRWLRAGWVREGDTMRPPTRAEVEARVPVADTADASLLAMIE